ncbi:MAG TPA: hypothetical protein VFA00_06945 [Actinomycetota bacterium]|nr:hypothetical protein [Actinomycetota bacterium]
MKKITVLFAAALLMVLALSWSAVATAQDPCDSGREYAQEHIVPLAQAGALGTQHVPGSHQGFAGAGEAPIC